jgi:geranylgeranyl diphosphate synthase type II
MQNQANEDAILLEFSNIINDFLSNEIAPLIIKESKNTKEVYEPILYSLLNGGKRFRPILYFLISGFDPTLEVQEKKEFLFTASAIEFIHTYSLIHDDLPAMDNDDIRRGIPTCHKKFPEWAAILAGDSLNTLAFYLISLTEYNVKEKVQILARYAGIAGMILGQAIDLSNEKKNYINSTENFNDFFKFLEDKNYYTFIKNYINHSNINLIQKLLMIHYHKTSALFRASVELGIITGRIVEHNDFNNNIYNKYIEYGEVLGLLFQITDDILDEIGDENQLGKKTKKDHVLGKLTFPTLFGLKNSINLAEKLAEYASLLVDDFLSSYTGKNYHNILNKFPLLILNRKK